MKVNISQRLNVHMHFSLDSEGLLSGCSVSVKEAQRHLTALMSSN